MSNTTEPIPAPHANSNITAGDCKSENGMNKYMIQLDSLRTIAVFTVIASHYAPNYTNHFAWGYAAVFLFFVLSGFLITGILLRARDKDENCQTSKFASLKRFYFRRTLRIFPLYYAIVLFCLFLLPTVRETWLWHMLYAVNFKIALNGDSIGLTTPFWSLGVEEQFYLIWPIIILFMPHKWLYPLFITLIAAGPVSRLIFVINGFDSVVFAYLPTSCLDALGLGSLLALSTHPSRDMCETNIPFSGGCFVGLFFNDRPSLIAS
jgi:peptidoglycan/LPS O-acetylase OafA/YrhL